MMYDVSADWWLKTVERLDIGITYPEAFWVGDSIMVGSKTSTTDVFNLWAFIEPFTRHLWVLTLGTIFVSGVAYYALDYSRSRRLLDYSGSRRLGYTQVDMNHVGHSIFLSFFAFTGHCNHEPKSRALKVLVTSMCFLYLILVAAYTANLAGFLVAKFSASSVYVKDIVDVLSKDKVICAYRAYPVTDKLKKEFPRGKFLGLETMPEMYAAVNDGRCFVTLATVEEWKQHQNDPEYNP